MINYDGYYEATRGLMIACIQGILTIEQIKPLIRKIHKKWKLSESR
jgi:hypothetical protein